MWKVNIYECNEKTGWGRNNEKYGQYYAVMENPAGNVVAAEYGRTPALAIFNLSAKLLNRWP